MNKRKKSLWSIIFTIFIIVMSIYSVVTMIGQQKILSAKSSELKSIQAKIDEESKTSDELKKQKDIVNSDEYVEKVAREKLGMVKHGEKVFVDVNK
jgi:cell division protein FtsB